MKNKKITVLYRARRARFREAGGVAVGAMPQNKARCFERAPALVEQKLYTESGRFVHPHFQPCVGRKLNPTIIKTSRVELVNALQLWEWNIAGLKVQMR